MPAIIKIGFGYSLATDFISKRNGRICLGRWSCMQGRLEGSQPLPNSDVKFPKQLASFPHKDEFGIYIRERLNIPLGQRILREDLIRYGRDTISFSLIEEGVYYLDFSV